MVDLGDCQDVEVRYATAVPRVSLDVEPLGLVGVRERLESV